MRIIILIAMFSLLSISTASAESIQSAFPRQSIEATDVVSVSLNNFHATVELEDDSVGVTLSQISYSGEGTTRCLDLASDISSGANSKITFYFEYETVSTGSSGTVVPGGNPSFDHLPITYNNVRIINCSAEKSTLLGDVNLDGKVSFLDISPFIRVLQSGEFQAEADCNQDGRISFLDISPFIRILQGG